MKRALWGAFVLVMMAAVAFGADDRTSMRRDAVVQAVEKAAPAVVNISTEKVVERQYFFDSRSPFNDPFFDPFMPRFSRPETAYSLGSGGLFTSDGYIFTNAHVVNRASKIMVTMSDGSQHPGTLVNVDLVNDLAVVKIEAPKPLPVLILGRSEDLMVGEQAIAVGNPFGLQNTVTSGVISATHRDVVVEDKVIFKDILQTDALINPGNSGGPLLNIFGEVIGVTTAMRSDAQGIGFAIPVDRVKKTLEGLLDPRKLRGVRLGLELKERYLDSGPAAQLVVASVEPEGPAATAGLAAGDIISGVDDHRVSSLVDFMAAIDVSAKSTMHLEGTRGSKDISVELAPVIIPKPDGVKLAKEMLGLSVQQMARSLAGGVGINIDKGVLVSQVAKNSPGAAAELAAGDVILQVNDTLTADMDTFAGVLEAGRESGKLYVVFLRRQGIALYQYATEVKLPVKTVPTEPVPAGAVPGGAD